MRRSRPPASRAARIVAALGLLALGLAACATAPPEPPLDPAYLAELCDLLAAPGHPEFDEAKGPAAARIAEIEQRLAVSGDKVVTDKKGRVPSGRCPRPGQWRTYVTLRISPDRALASREAIGGLQQGPCFYEKVEQRWRLAGCRVDWTDPSLVT